MQIGAMRAHRNTMPNPAVQGLMASPSATAGAHLRTLALLCLIVSYDLSWVVRLLFLSDQGPRGSGSAVAGTMSTHGPLCALMASVPHPACAAADCAYRDSWRQRAA